MPTPDGGAEGPRAVLVNARTGEVIAGAVEIADTRATRRRGLLGRDRLDPSAALVLAPCFAIHTAFMRFSIDAVFINRDGVVVRIVRDLAPWRLAAAWRARAVIEVTAGVLGARDLQVGDRVYLSSVPDGGGVARPSSSAISSLRRMASKPACSGS
jgi:uncharacterized membrane protein (UPF0127 family)